jgi:hypothetical protein
LYNNQNWLAEPKAARDASIKETREKATQ